MNRTMAGGYAGLLVLLIVCCLMALLFWRLDLFSGSGAATSTPPIRQDLNDIQAARNAQQQINQYNQQLQDAAK